MGILFNAHAQMSKGDVLANLGIGLGMLGNSDYNKVSFTQNAGVQWCVADQLPHGISLSAGFNINNGVTNFGETTMSGSYDYTYTTTITYRYPKNPSANRTEERVHRRTGAGTCKSNVTRNDVNLMPVASIHFPATSKLDLSLTIGVGLGVLHNIVGEKRDMDGFKSTTYHETAGTQQTFFVTSSYSYNDLNHVEWAGFKQTSLCFSASCYATARYALTENWGIEGKVGLIGGNFKKSVGSSYNLFSLGASYRF